MFKAFFDKLILMIRKCKNIELRGFAHLMQVNVYSRRKYRVNHKLGNARFLLIVSQLMKVEKKILDKMKGTYESFKMAPTLSCCYEYF